MKEGKSIQHATEASLSAAVHFKFANWLDALEITAAQEIPICALQASLPTNTIQFNSRIQSFDAQSLSLSLRSCEQSACPYDSGDALRVASLCIFSPRSRKVSRRWKRARRRRWFKVREQEEREWANPHKSFARTRGSRRSLPGIKIHCWRSW